VTTSQTRATSLLIDDLRQLQRRAGSPTLGELAGYSQKMPEVTFRRLISRHRSSLPPWAQVAAFVTACHAAAESTGINKDQLGTLEEWSARWESARSGDLGSARMFEPTVQFNALDAEGEPGLEASIEEVLQRLGKDLSRLQKPMSRYSALLISISGPKFGTIYTVESNVTTIGRHPGCDIWLLDTTVSHRHAKIYRFGTQFTIRDEGSLNGIRRRNIRLKNSVLRSYDELRIGKLRFLFVQGGDSKEGFRSPRYDPARRRLIQDITAKTVDIEPFDSLDDDPG
jgi:Inner membrane component of T3SS, cytoplasmic domain